MMEKAIDVSIALTSEEVYKDTELTHPLNYTSATAKQLISLAKKQDVQVSTPIILKNQYRLLNNTLTTVDIFLLQKPLKAIL